MVWSLKQIIFFVLAPIAWPIELAICPLPDKFTSPHKQQESFFEGLATIFLYARIPYNLVVRKMWRVFKEVGDLTLIMEIVFRTSYNRPFDEEANPEGLEHRGSDFQTKWDKCIDDIGWWYCSSGPCTVLVGIGAVFVGNDYLNNYIPKDASPALRWCGWLYASNVAWATLYLAIFNSCIGMLKGAHIGASWASYAEGVQDNFWWNWPMTLGLPAIYVYWSIAIRLVLQLLVICQQGNPQTESPSAMDLSGNFFKACFVLYNLLGLAHFVGTIGFWRVFVVLPDWWKGYLSPPGREMGLRKLQEHRRELQRNRSSIDAAAIPSGPIMSGTSAN